MGLFDKIKKTAGMAKDVVTTRHTAVQPAYNPPDRVQLWRMPQPQRAVIIRGDRVATLYLYNPAPLAGVQIGQTLELEAVRGDVAMTGINSGITWDTADHGGVAFAYNGQIIGIASLESDAVRKAAEQGYMMFAEARCDGILADHDGLLDINLYIPSYFSAEQAIEKDKAWMAGARGVIEIKEIVLSDEAQYRALATRDYWEIPFVRIELIPPQGKSKAKPSLGVYAQDGTLFLEIGSRRKIHGELMELRERCSGFYVFARRKSDYSGHVYYDVDLLYW